MPDIFTFRKNPDNIWNIGLFGFENPRSVRFGVDAIAFRSTQLWQKVPISIKDSSSLEIFKAKKSYRTATVARVTFVKDLSPMLDIHGLYNQFI